MRILFLSFSVGLLFGMGLGVAEMTNPNKIWSFLDLFGDWDPSLMFVMVGAIAVHGISYKLIMKKESPLFGGKFQVPTRRDLTPRLFLGAALFGIGWGLGGFCPGPGLTSLSSGATQPALFVLSMLFGMFLFQSVGKRLPIRG